MQTSNHELIAAIIDGDTHRYGEIMRLFNDRVRATIAFKIADPATVDDLVQETFCKAFQQLNRLEDRNRLGAWLVTIAKNCVNDHYRKPQTRNEQLQSFDTSAGTIELTSTEEWIWDEVDQLPENFACILRLRYRLSLSYEEIAARLKLPVSTVRGRIFEARKTLKLRLKNKRIFP